jgi:hypothetical protein
MLEVEMLRVTELVVRVMRVAGVAVAGRNDNGIVLSGFIGELVLACGRTGGGAANNRQDAFNTFVVGS